MTQLDIAPSTVELNLGQLVTAIAAQVPDRPAVLQGERKLSYRELVERSTRLARYLSDRGLGCYASRAQLAGHEVGQHLLAQYLHNGAEYLEGLVGSYLARVAPFNVNYRYRADELTHLLTDAAPTVIQYHAAFAPLLEQVLPRLAGGQVLLQVDDGSGNPLLPGAVDYEEALASVPAEIASIPSPDDLYVIYTGGTTGMPKGVLWRQADVAVATIGLLDRRADREWSSVEECVGAVRAEPTRVLPVAPMMHGAAQWAALQALGEGNTVVFPERAQSFSAAAALEAIQRHGVNVITFVGDAFGWPLVEEIERADFDLSTLRVVVSGGAALHANCKSRLLSLVPGLRIVENIGSSESGVLGSQRSDRSAAPREPRFMPGGSTVVISEDFGRILEPGHEGVGWLARRGRIPLGYLGHPERTARTFPVVDGVPLAVPGDRARLLPDGRIHLLGRDSLTVNTGGEKVFVEEVEAVLKNHPGVVDALVCGRPSDRWGSEVVALVVSRGVDPTALQEFCRAKLAAYKAPKSIRFVERIVRGSTGKPDYQWASEELGRPDPAPRQGIPRCHSYESRSGDPAVEPRKECTIDE